jgi:hypothetical protein
MKTKKILRNYIETLENGRDILKARVRVLEEEIGSMVPISADGKFVFIEGLGDVALLPKEGPDVEVDVVLDGIGHIMVQPIKIVHNEDASYTAVVRHEDITVARDGVLAAQIESWLQEELDRKHLLTEGEEFLADEIRRLIVPEGDLLVSQPSEFESWLQEELDQQNKAHDEAMHDGRYQNAASLAHAASVLERLLERARVARGAGAAGGAGTIDEAPVGGESGRQ